MKKNDSSPQEGERLWEYISTFLNYCRFRKNLSAKTIAAYRTDLTQYCQHVTNSESNPDIDFISKKNIEEFIASIHYLSSASKRRKVASLKTFFSFLYYEDIIEFNPFQKIKVRIKQEKKLPRTLSEHELKQFFNHVYSRANIENSFENQRNLILIELLFNTGARVSEICALKYSSIDFNTGIIQVVGKGKKHRIIHLSNMRIVETIQFYLNTYSNQINKSGGYILTNRVGQQMSTNSVRSVIRKMCLKLRLSLDITPHVFRHTLATMLLENEVDLTYIQSILGHSSITTTQIYTHVNLKRQMEIIRTRHPRNGFSLE